MVGEVWWRCECGGRGVWGRRCSSLSKAYGWYQPSRPNKPGPAKMLEGGFLDLAFNWLLCQLNLPPMLWNPKLCWVHLVHIFVHVGFCFVLSQKEVSSRAGIPINDSILGSRNCWEVSFINGTYNCIFFITTAALNCLHLLPGSTLLHLQLGSPHSTAANLCSVNLYPEGRLRLPP